ncbi:MAG: hypothetical protein M1835_007153 [Candelina submexicana]|nr:MAG: hypothetical protein M1835_007153 [Candelina submexicana]
MAPVRRYLRITNRSVLECRIYLDNPALAKTWLLNPRDPILPRVIEAVRPLVLPKLREENERSKGKGGKGRVKKGVKDIVVEGMDDDFEVSIFLTELSSRHTLLTKQKLFVDKDERLEGNSAKMATGWNAMPIEVDDEAPALVREESDEHHAGLVLADIPSVADTEYRKASSTRGAKRRSGNDGLFVEEFSGEPGIQTQSIPAAKRKKGDTMPGHIGNKQQDVDDKKKLALNTSYDGFNIYGRILCLVVKRKEMSKARTADGRVTIGGQAMMEDWIASTQVTGDQEN